jgi:hypothetical protein
MTPNLRTIGTIAVQLVLTAVVSLLLGFGLTANSFSDRTSFLAAFHQYKDNPTTEKKLVFENEREIVLRDRYRLMWGVVALAFVLFNAAVVVARRKLPGVVKEGTFGACAGWMVLGAMIPGPGLPAHWRAGGKIVWGSFIDAERNTAIGMTLGLVLGMIPAMWRWWKGRHAKATALPLDAG